MKYTVEIGWFTFEFDDVTTAANFAELALTHIKGDKETITIRISKGDENDD